MKSIKQRYVHLLGCVAVAVAMAGAAKGASVFQMRLVAENGSENPTPAQFERMILVTVNPANGQTNRETLYVQKVVLLDQRDLKATEVTSSPKETARIDFELTPGGQKRFAEVTRQNLGKRLAIIIDGQVYVAPIIRTEITGGRGSISGNFNRQEAKQLSDRINAALKK